MRRIASGVTILFTVGVVVLEHFLKEPPVLLLFAIASLTLIGLAWVLGQVTESVGHYASPRIGGILKTTFGNAAELASPSSPSPPGSRPE
jgi:calcium/proton exchanger cax